MIVVSCFGIVANQLLFKSPSNFPNSILQTQAALETDLVVNLVKRHTIVSPVGAFDMLHIGGGVLGENFLAT